MCVKLRKERLEKLGKQLQKYRYPALILLLGVLLLLLPSHNGKESVVPTPAKEEALQGTEEALAELLSRIDGAGQVRVMLSIAEGEETLYQTDLETDGDRAQQQTVLAESGASAEAPVERKTIGVVYRGAVVVAEGGDRASVRLSLAEAVASLTGLGTDRITVVKMNTN